MNCREFENGWHDLLDLRSGLAADLEAGLEAHASACPRCLAASGRYRPLRLAVAALQPPVASPEWVARLRTLEVPAPAPARSRRPWPRLLGPIAAAAALFALAWLGAGRRSSPPPAGPALAAPSPRDRDLGRSLVDATEATIDLALEVSAPASRIGREVLELGHPPAEGTDPDPLPVPRPDLLRSVGERLGAGVGPISGSARHAFSFLLGPADAPGPAPPESRGSL